MLLLTCFSIRAQTQDNTITWITQKESPYWILTGPEKGEGISDQVESFIQKYLPEYQHKDIVTNMSRMKSMLKSGENYCTSNKIKTPEREGYMHFSRLPSGMGVAMGLAIHKRDQEKVNSKQGDVDLALLLSKTDMILGIEVNRNYGSHIDKIISSMKNTPRIYTSRQVDSSQSLFRMLIGGRINIILNYDVIVDEMIRKGSNQNDVVFYNIKGVKPYIFGYIGCTKNDWGKQVIEKIEQILLEHRPSTRYRDIMTKRRMNKDSYRKLYDDVFLKATLDDTI